VKFSKLALFTPDGVITANIRICQLASVMHQIKHRYFAHAHHIKNTICITPEFLDLPAPNQTGILLHELGHLLGFNEEEADNFARSIDISYHYDLQGLQKAYLVKSPFQ
jgi:hypothetical protein